MGTISKDKFDEGYSISKPFITGKTISNENFTVPICICFGYFIIQVNEKYGIINEKDEEVLKPKYDELRYYGGNIVVCKKDNVCGSFNFVSGKMELDMKYEELIVIFNDTNNSSVGNFYASIPKKRKGFGFERT